MIDRLLEHVSIPMPWISVFGAPGILACIAEITSDVSTPIQILCMKAELLRTCHNSSNKLIKMQASSESSISSGSCGH